MSSWDASQKNAKNASINYRGRNLRTAVNNAAWVGQIDILLELVKNGADLNIPDIDGDTPLILSVEKFNCSVVEKLIHAGSHIEKRGNQGQTALLNACTKNKPEIVKCLASNNADLNIADDFNNTALMRASISGSIKVIEFLHSNNLPCEIDKRGIMNRTALQLAIVNDRFDSVSKLLKLGADPHVKDQDLYTPISLAVAHSDCKMIELVHSYNSGRLASCQNSKNTSS